MIKYTPDPMVQKKLFGVFEVDEWRVKPFEQRKKGWNV